MIKKKKICKTCKTEQFIWKSGNCKSCSSKINPSKPIKKSYISKQLSEKAIAKKEEKKEYTKKQFELFLEFYDNHQTKRCEQCNCKISQCLSINVHHLLPKSVEKYKKIALNSQYWMLLCGDCHSNWESNNKGEKIAIRTVEAKVLFQFNEDEYNLWYEKQ